MPESAPLTPAVEDYVKAIYVLESDAGSATTTALAERLDVRPASVSGMLPKLTQLGLVEHEPYRGVRPPERGPRVALEIVRHHRLLELFLVESLGMTWDEVHAEAEVLEHVLSEELEELIAAKLGDPAYDPHGDPIPSRELTVPADESRSLYGLEPGASATFVRVSDSDPAMLRFLSERGIAPGAELEGVDRPAFARPLYVRVGDDRRVRGAPPTGRGACASETACTCSAPFSPAPCGSPYDAPGRRPRRRRPRPARRRQPARGPVRARPPPRHARNARSGVRRRHRLCRSRQLRHQPPGRREVRLPPALGRARREPHGDAHPVPV